MSIAPKIKPLVGHFQNQQPANGRLLGRLVAADLPGKSIVLGHAQNYVNNRNLPGKSAAT